MVWLYALPDPRIVNIRERPLKKTILQCVLDKDEEKRARGETCQSIEDRLRPGTMLARIGSGHANGLTSDTLPPSMLFVCRESFSVASKIYKRVFGLHDSVPAAYFSFRDDTLYLRYDNWTSGRYCMDSFCEAVPGFDDEEENVIKIENLAILLRHEELENIWSRIDLNSWIPELLFRFKGLKRLTLVVQHYQHKDSIIPTCFIEPIDFLEAWMNYSCFVTGSEDEGILQVPAHPKMIDLDLDLMDIEQQCQEDIGVDYQIPQIKFQIAVSETENEEWVALQNQALALS